MYVLTWVLHAGSFQQSNFFVAFALTLLCAKCRNAEETKKRLYTREGRGEGNETINGNEENGAVPPTAVQLLYYY